MEKGTILVVDDDRTIRESLQRLLSRKGYGVQAAASAEEALLRLREARFDLVLTDLRMPGLSGLELLAEIKRRSPNTPVVMLTAHASTEVVIQALRSGVSDFVPKPFRPEDLVSIVEREVSRHRKAAPVGLTSGLGYQLSVGQIDELERLLAELRAEVTARCILLVEGSGNVVSTKGHIEDLNVSALAALVAGDFAATSTIASLIGEGDAFRLNYHEGLKYSVYSAQVGPDLFLLIVFGQEVRLGSVLHYARQIVPQMQRVVGAGAQVSPRHRPPRPPTATVSPPTEAPEALLPDVDDAVEELPALLPVDSWIDSAVPVFSPKDEASGSSADIAAGADDSGPRFTFEEIKRSGLLEEDLLAKLDAQFAQLWGPVPEGVGG